MPVIQALIAPMFFALLLMGQASWADLNCRLEKPIPLPQHGGEWAMKRPKFYPLWQTGCLVPDYTERTMVLDLFRIYHGEELTPWLGAAFRTAKRTPWWSWIGFAQGFGENMYVTGTVTPTPRGVIYETTAGNVKPSDPLSMYQQVRMVIEDNHIVELKLTVPVTLPCEADAKNAWCPWIGTHETSCLTSGSFE